MRHRKIGNVQYHRQRVDGKRSKERDQKSELVLRSTYQIFEWDQNNSDRSFDFWVTNRIAADRIL